MSNQMQSVAAQAAIGQEPVTKTFTIAITGDACSDLMAAIRRVADDSALSARQVQYIFECYAKLYKDAADGNDRCADQKWQSQETRLAEMNRQLQAERNRGLMASPVTPWTTASPSGPMYAAGSPLANIYPSDEAKAAYIAKVIAQSGIHSPSTMRPDSAAGSGSGPALVEWPDGSVYKAPGAP